MGLPKGRLFSSRRYGRYGNYMTWKLLKTLAILAMPDSERRKAWTSKLLAKEVGMSNYRMLRLLERAKKKGWVEWGKDAFGRRSWVLLESGMATLHKELHRKVAFALGKNKTLSENLIKIVNRAMKILKYLKSSGFRDIQARETLINFPIRKIEWAIRTVEKRWWAVHDKGKYLWNLINYGNQNERRCRVFLMRVAHGMSPESREEIVKQAMRTTRPFFSASLIFEYLRGRRKSLWEIVPDDVGEVTFALYRMGKIRHRPVKYFVA